MLQEIKKDASLKKRRLNSLEEIDGDTVKIVARYLKIKERINLVMVFKLL